MRKIIFTACLSMAFIWSYAGGFRVSLQGVRQAAMAHTSAHTRDASVAFFNPAGIAFIPSKLSIAGGGFGVISKAMLQVPSYQSSAETENPVSTPFNLAVSYKFTKDFSAALSVTSPFGSSIDWGGDWMGKNIIRDITLQAIYIQPTLAFKITDWFSIGGGYIYAMGKADLSKSVSNLGNGDMRLKADDAEGHGYNVGIYLRPTPDFDVSFAYRSEVKIKGKKGDVFVNAPASTIKDDKFDTTIPMAPEFTLGLTYRIDPQWSISADWVYSIWGVYEYLSFDFYENTIGNDPNDPTIATSPRKFKNSNTYRIGGEYLPNDKWALRLGYYYDQSPVSDEYWNPETPSTDNHAVTAGLGYKLTNNLHIDLTYLYLMGQERRVRNEGIGLYGQAKSYSHMIGVGLAWNAF